MNSSTRYFAAWPLLVASGVVFAQVITFRALVTWVGISVLVTWWVASRLTAVGQRWSALVAGGVAVVVAAVATEYLAGTSDGPVTRSVIVACGLTVAMVLMLTTQWPLLVLVPGLGLAGCGLALGGAGNSLLAVGVLTVAVAVTAVMLGPYRGALLRDRAHLPVVALALAGVGLVAVAAGTLAWQVVGGAGEVSRVDPLPPGASASPTPIASSAPSAASASIVGWASGMSGMPWWMWLLVLLVVIAFVVLIVVLLMLLWGVVVRAWIGMRWARVRRTLRHGDPDARVVGAWSWARMRRVRYESPLPVSASPDIVRQAAGASGDESLAQVAMYAAAVTFDPHARVSTGASDLAWRAAREAGARPRGTWDDRWRWSRRGPRKDDSGESSR